MSNQNIPDCKICYMELGGNMYVKYFNDFIL